jgi:hypothetical protein
MIIEGRKKKKKKSENCVKSPGGGCVKVEAAKK